MQKSNAYSGVAKETATAGRRFQFHPSVDCRSNSKRNSLYVQTLVVLTDSARFQVQLSNSPTFHDYVAKYEYTL